MQCYDRTQLGCGSVTATPLPSGVRIALVNACDGDECNVGKDQSIDIDTTTGPKYWGIFARNLIGRYSWGVAADSLGTVTDPGPVRGDATEDGDGGDIPGTVEGPKVTISVTPLEGDSPLRVRFMGNAVSVFAIDESKTEWDFDIDSRDDPVAKTRNAEYVYTVPAGESQDFTARLTMVDVQNNIGSASVMIRVRGPETDGSGSPIGESSLRILVGVPGNPTADESSGKSPFAVELSVDASSLQGTLQSIVWDLGDGTSPRPTSLVVPHTYVNTSNADLVIPITVTATTVTSGSVSIRTSATRLITVEPGTGSIGPGPMPPDGGDGGDGGSNTCGALGLFPLLGIFGTMMGFRRMRT